MSMPSLTTTRPERRSVVLTEIATRRADLLDTYDSNVAHATPDDLALAGACFVLPQYAHDRDRRGTPRMWPWHDTVLTIGLRRVDLVLAAAYFAIAADRIGLPTHILQGAGDRAPDVLNEVAAARAALIGPTPGDPARSRRASATDALAFAAACYALPLRAREIGLCGVPLLWPWPNDLYEPGDRRADLVLAAALTAAEIERLDRSRKWSRSRLTVSPGGAR